MSHAQTKSNVVYLYPDPEQEYPGQAHDQVEQPQDYAEQAEDYFTLYAVAPLQKHRKPLRFLAPLGWLLILLTLTFNIWTVEALFVPGGRLEWPNTFYVYLLQVSMATAGAMLLLVHCNYRTVLELLGKQD